MPRKLYAIFRAYLHECFAYPAASFIWVLADAQSAILLPAVWLAAGPGTVAGMGRAELVTYYLASMTLAQFITCHLMWDMAEDIREGYFSTMLVRPISHFATNAARNMSWRLSKLVLFLPIAFIVYSVYLGMTGGSPIHLTPAFFLSFLLAHTLSFVAAYCVALVALWTVEFQSVLRLYYFPEYLLSGRLVPIGALPGWAAGLAGFLHFRYTNAFPVEMLLGRLSAEQVRNGLLAQCAWIAFFVVLGRVLFRRGVRQYTGVGM